MNPLLRRLATLLLLFAVPLRVYAAAAMVFCGQPADGMHGVHAAFALVEEQSSVTMMNRIHDHHDAGSMAHEDHRHDAAGGADAQDHLSCAACCCTGMIATALYDWKPQPSAAPATPSFVATAVPHAVPHRLERPPRARLA